MWHGGEKFSQGQQEGGGAPLVMGEFPYLVARGAVPHRVARGEAPHLATKEGCPTLQLTASDAAMAWMYCRSPQWSNKYNVHEVHLVFANVKVVGGSLTERISCSCSSVRRGFIA